MESIVTDPGILGGTPVFRGTRVPVKTMLDYLASGVYSMQDFLEDYPSVAASDAKKVFSALSGHLLDDLLAAA